MHLLEIATEELDTRAIIEIVQTEEIIFQVIVLDRVDRVDESDGVINFDEIDKNKGIALS